MFLSDAFVAEALKWKNTPWVDGGRSNLGMDCLGLIIVSAQKCGLPVKDHPDIRSRSGMHTLLEAAGTYCDEIPVREIRKGAILLAHIRGEKDARHIMIYDGYAIVHCGMHWMRVVHHRLSDELRRTIRRAWVFKKEWECQAH